ncbi:hypothetical protein GCM10011515_08490 [Tsuneonella deserti]|uniref:KfrA N-terminal DNA-binding domain-containing protein n=1 Tax=Tsuneonella deserti TaxID=2035528 RepID=A0ABQ1S5D2_9SPHN|nr:hypothetical protein [Tsuneonella deserti]GGD91121.1 hypothetical protein GCM10011515_08490 [Tsuneonella deserti]
MSVSSDIQATLHAIMAEMKAVPDRQLGGPAAATARLNAQQVADYLRGLGNTPLPRHAGKASPGKVAKEISTPERRFNRQNFTTNEWCDRLLNAYDEWEISHGLSRMEMAQAGRDEKEVTNQRVSDLERELLYAQAEIASLRRELAFLRNFTAETGQLP